jgi:hypothetical protein
MTEKAMRNIRHVTSALLALPYIFLVIQLVDSYILRGGTDALFWGLFCITLLPSSVVILLTHAILAMVRRKRSMEVKPWDTNKVVLASIGAIIGLLCWGVLVIATTV